MCSEMARVGTNQSKIKMERRDPPLSARTDSARIGERPTGALWRGGMEMEGWDLRALAVLERLNAAGHRAVLVGGCVRDRLMGRTPHDYDAATSARPEQIREACGDRRAARDGHRSVRRPAGGGDLLPPGGAVHRSPPPGPGGVHGGSGGGSGPPGLHHKRYGLGALRPD